jgi:catalase
VTSREAFVAVSRALSFNRLLVLPRLIVRWAIGQFRSPLVFFTQFAPSSYAHCDYYAVHTFLWTSGEKNQPVRYRWRACDGRRRLVPWTRLFKPRDYLTVELGTRLADHGAVRFTLEVQRPHGMTEARLRDVGRPLPGNVTWDPVGDLDLTEIIADDQELSQMVFSPAHLAEGVEPYPGDEIFLLRSAAYPASHVFRSSGAS